MATGSTRFNDSEEYARTLSPAKKKLLDYMENARAAALKIRCGDDIMRYLRSERKSDGSLVELGDIKFSGLIDSAKSYDDFETAYYNPKKGLGILQKIRLISDEEAEKIVKGYDLLTGVPSGRGEKSMFHLFAKTNKAVAPKIVECCTASLEMQDHSLQGIFREQRKEYKGNWLSTVPVLRHVVPTIDIWLSGLNHAFLVMDRWLHWRVGLGLLTRFREGSNFIAGLNPDSASARARKAWKEGDAANEAGKRPFVALERDFNDKVLKNLAPEACDVMAALMDYSGISTSSLQNFSLERGRSTEKDTYEAFDKISPINEGLHRAWTRNEAIKRRAALSGGIKDLTTVRRESYHSYNIAQFFYVPEINQAWRDLQTKMITMLGSGNAKDRANLLRIQQMTADRDQSIQGLIGLQELACYIGGGVVANQINFNVGESGDFNLSNRNAVLRGGDMRWMYPVKLAASSMLYTETAEDPRSAKNQNIRMNPLVQSVLNFFQTIFPMIRVGKESHAMRQIETVVKMRLISGVSTLNDLVTQATNVRNNSEIPVEQVIKKIYEMTGIVQGLAVGGFNNAPLFNFTAGDIAQLRGHRLSLPDNAKPEEVMRALAENFYALRERLRDLITLGDKPELTINSVNPATVSDFNPTDPLTVRVQGKSTFADFGLTVDADGNPTIAQGKNIRQFMYILEPDMRQLLTYAQQCEEGTTDTVSHNDLSKRLQANGCFLKEDDIAGNNLGLQANAEALAALKSQDSNVPSWVCVDSDMILALYKRLKKICPELDPSKTIPYLDETNNPSPGMRKLIPLGAKTFGVGHANNAGAQDYYDLRQYVRAFGYEGPKVFWHSLEDGKVKVGDRFEKPSLAQPALTYVDAEYSNQCQQFFKDDPSTGQPSPDCDLKGWVNHHATGTKQGIKTQLEARQTFAGTLDHRHHYEAIDDAIISSAARLENVYKALNNLADGVEQHAAIAGRRDGITLDRRGFGNMVPILGHALDWVLSWFGARLYKTLPRPSATRPFKDIISLANNTRVQNNIVPSYGLAASSIFGVDNHTDRAKKISAGQAAYDAAMLDSPASYVQKIMNQSPALATNKPQYAAINPTAKEHQEAIATNNIVAFLHKSHVR